MTSAELYEWMVDPSLLTRTSLAELKQLVDEYPYFHAARMLYLKNLAVLRDVRLERELKRMSVFVPDRRQLYLLINEPRLDDALEVQQPSIGRSSGTNKTEEVLKLVERVLGNPTESEVVVKKTLSPMVAASDYVHWLAENAEDLPAVDGGDNRLQHQDLIDSFISGERNPLSQQSVPTNDVRTATGNEPSEPSGPSLPEKNVLDDSFFTETLARVYIKQKRYEKALEIIRVLSLKYPEKSAYFADQIQYLEKIINIKQ